jgi:hypothetical protein
MTWGNAIAADAESRVFIAGYVSGSVDFGGGELTSGSGGLGLVVAGFTAGGDCSWAKSFGKPVERVTMGIAVDPLSHLIVVGGFWGVLDFGCGPLASAGAQDAFVAALVR